MNATRDREVKCTGNLAALALIVWRVRRRILAPGTTLPVFGPLCFQRGLLADAGDRQILEEATDDKLFVLRPDHHEGTDELPENWGRTKVEAVQKYVSGRLAALDENVHWALPNAPTIADDIHQAIGLLAE